MDFEIVSNADWIASVDLGQPGDTWTLAGCAVSGHLRFPPLPPALDLAPYLTIDDPASRTVLVAVPALVLWAMPAGAYPYDLVVFDTQSGLRTRRAAGTVTIERGVTSPSALYSTAVADMAAFVQLNQLLQALESSGAGRVATVRAAIPADPGDPLNIAWTSGGYVTIDGPIGLFIKTTLALGDTAMASLFSAAKLKAV